MIKKVVKKIEQNQYDFAQLSEETIQQIQTLEKSVSNEEKERIILIAYHPDN